MAPHFEIVRAEVEHAEAVVGHRRAMFFDMGHRDEAALDRMIAEFRPWVTAKMEAGQYLAWLATAPGGAVAGGAGLWLMDWPPHITGSGSVRGNILNVYTQPEYRRLGVARLLVTKAIDWCRGNGVSCVILHASADGRALYESLGFRATNEMRILL